MSHEALPHSQQFVPRIAMTSSTSYSSHVTTQLSYIASWPSATICTCWDMQALSMGKHSPNSLSIAEQVRPEFHQVNNRLLLWSSWLSWLAGLTLVRDTYSITLEWDWHHMMERGSMLIGCTGTIDGSQWPAWPCGFGQPILFVNQDLLAQLS